MTSRFLLRYHRSQHHVTIVTIQGRCRRLNFRFVFLSKFFFMMMAHQIEEIILYNMILTFYDFEPYVHTTNVLVVEPIQRPRLFVAVYAVMLAIAIYCPFTICKCANRTIHLQFNVPRVNENLRSISKIAFHLLQLKNIIGAVALCGYKGRKQ